MSTHCSAERFIKAEKDILLGGASHQSFRDSHCMYGQGEVCPREANSKKGKKGSVRKEKGTYCI